MKNTLKIKEKLGYNKSGIYAIYHPTNGRIYIGSSVDLRKRFDSHRSLLKRKTHPNKYLLNDFCKSNIDFYFIVLEFCNQQNLLTLEQEYIDLYFDNQNMCYNIDSIAGQHSHFHRMKTHTVISPDNKEYNFTGIRQFCRNNKLHYSAFCQMLNGQIISASGGWRLPCNINNAINQTVPKYFNITLIDPIGVMHENIFNLEQFCKKHKLRASSVRHLIAGRIKSTLGWRLKTLYKE